MGPETKIYCAGEDQQQFYRPIDWPEGDCNGHMGGIDIHYPHDPRLHPTVYSNLYLLEPYTEVTS
jgi:hypothetical protein